MKKLLQLVLGFFRACNGRDWDRQNEARVQAGKRPFIYW